MTKEETIDILRQYNEWRRGAEIDQPHPTTIGIAIDNAIKLLKL
jgi:hypothetical protein